jgi:hypothetical protein
LKELDIAARVGPSAFDSSEPNRRLERRQLPAARRRRHGEADA